MYFLKEEEIEYIKKKLDIYRLDNAGFKAEILDHLCSEVESLLAINTPFTKAVELAMSAFEEDEMQEIQKQINSIHSKKRLFMKVSLLTLGFMMIFSGMFWTKNVPAPENDHVLLPEIISLPDPPEIAPIAGDIRIVSGFGMRIHPVFKKKQMHRGIDLKAPEGTPVVATSAGTVVKAEFEQNYGNHIIIRHDSLYQSLYAHLAEMNISEGQEVTAGMQIGTVGSTGKSTAPHLHYEVIKEGNYQNPELYLGMRED